MLKSIYLLINLAILATILIALHFHIAIADHIGSLTNSINDKWRQNQATEMRIGIALGQIERDIIRIRQLTKKGGGHNGR